ncbi:hypothetical protein M513_10976 [Trichuris suis]|uniref:Uncharacterized protein n=1 Tax=Trichuris suis TaxID=68888 RepID=A0A085LT42_9BILA|nr:hypothetical protein M513_10976 [Trichuris suis]
MTMQSRGAMLKLISRLQQNVEPIGGRLPWRYAQADKQESVSWPNQRDMLIFHAFPKEFRPI